MHLPAKANSLTVQTFMANKSLSDSDSDSDARDRITIKDVIRFAKGISQTACYTRVPPAARQRMEPPGRNHGGTIREGCTFWSLIHTHTHTHKTTLVKLQKAVCVRCDWMQLQLSSFFISTQVLVFVIMVNLR